MLEKQEWQTVGSGPSANFVLANFDDSDHNEIPKFVKISFNSIRCLKKSLATLYHLYAYTTTARRVSTGDLASVC